MAITLGVYTDLIEIFSSFYKPKIIKKHFLFLCGMVLGILIAIGVFLNFYERFSFVFLSFFIGLMATSFFKKEEKRKRKIHNYITMILIFIGTILFDLIGNFRIISFDGKYLVFTYIFVFFVSILSALALVLPGISGAMVLFVFGVYEIILKSFKGIIDFLLYSRTLLGGQMAILCVFLGGFLVGILAFSKIIDKFSRQNKGLFYDISMAFLAGSMVILLVDLAQIVMFSRLILLSVVIIICGFLLGFKLIKKVA